MLMDSLGYHKVITIIFFAKNQLPIKLFTLYKVPSTGLVQHWIKSRLRATYPFLLGLIFGIIFQGNKIKAKRFIDFISS